MRRQLRAIRPDALLTYNWGSVEWLMSARLSGCRPVVHHEDGFGPVEPERRLPRATSGYPARSGPSTPPP